MIKIIQGECREELRKMQVDSVDCVVTSPPYWGLRDYKLPPTVWDADPKCEHEWGTEGFVRKRDSLGSPTFDGGQANQESQGIGIQTGNFCSKCSAWKGQLGLEPDFHLYIKHLLQVTKELKRVLKPTGCLWLNLGDTYSGSWGNYGNRPEESGIDNGQRERTTEYLERQGHPDAKTFPIQVKTGVAPKSLCFIPQRIALANHETLGWTSCSCNASYCPGIVLDPFGGSGTTALVAAKLGRDAIIIEQKPEYCEITRKRLEPWMKQTRLGLMP